MDKENDVEVENTISRNVHDSDIDMDKPLSPVLCSSRPNFFKRRAASTKSRVKLSKRFETEEQMEKSVDIQVKQPNESFSLINSDDLMNCLDRLEEIEKNRQAAYKVLLANRKSNFTFKKPVSPAPKSLKSLRYSPVKSNIKLEPQNHTKVGDICENITSVTLSPIELPKISNFQTATGKIISVTQENIEKHSKLFEDINLSQHENNRKNKHNFLIKPSKTTVLTNYPIKNVSLAQETCPSKVSATEKGFNKHEIAESETLNNKLKILTCIVSKTKDSNYEKRKFESCDLLSNKKIKLDKNSGFSSASGEKMSFTTNSLNKAKNIFVDLNSDDQELEFINQNRAGKSGFSSASGTEITNNLNKVKNIIEDKDLEINKEKIYTNLDNVKNISETKHSKSHASVNDKLKYFDQLIGDDCDFIQSPKNSSKPLCNKSELDYFNKQLGKNTHQDKDLEINKEKIYTNLDKVSNVKNISETKPSKCHASVKDKLKYFDQLIGDDCDFIPSAKNSLEKTIGSSKPLCNNKSKLDYFNKQLGKNTLQPQNVGTFSSASGKTLQLSSSALKRAKNIFDDIFDENPTNFTTPIKNLNTPDGNNKKSKKKLGLSSCKQIPIPESKLQKAKLIFGEDFSGISPIKPLVQNLNFCSTPVRNNYTELNTTDMTEKTVIIEQKEDLLKLKDDCIVTFDEPIEKDVAHLEVDFQKELKRLKKEILVINTRYETIRTLKEEKPNCDKKPKQGVLYKSKNQTNRMSLKSFTNQETLCKHLEKQLFCITPQNAINIHFKESSAIVLTEDGATIIPNVKNLIGLSEIEFAFERMQGVDPKLIPKGWIKNHYKWIVWKLTSYQRMFPITFKGSLCVEHVVQQLKYRYEREIDKAERSSLRKILEKDDAPNKRIVLCVSDIKKLDAINFELELTDGWYSIRTQIDEPLCHQILKGKLQIGTKLIISGATLINCDGCHPLDVTDLTFLKINFNSTRRAKWDTRLGYQKFPEPFTVPIHSVHPAGGIIGSINVCIARVYPIKYLDKSENRSVWRNKKAEEIKAQEWENERHRRLNKLEEVVRKEFSLMYDNENKRVERKISNVDISGITCPKTLMEVMESSNDPDSIQEIMTTSQKSILLDYKRNLMLSKQQEMAARVKQSAEKIKMASREVIPVLKLLLVDLNGSPTKGFHFYLWRPSESQILCLKEETCLSIYNLLPKTNGDLSSVPKTVYREKSNKEHMSVIFKRKLIPIAELNDLKFSINLNEFDTVGIVVEILVEADSQEIWLCDMSGRLLVVKVFESLATCMLFDGLKTGQVTSASNLVYRGLTDDVDVCKATANHFTVFSSYPKHKHLQGGLEEIQKELYKDLAKLMEECHKKIETFRKKALSKNSFSSRLENYDEDTLTPSRITSTDIALSLIDMDKFI